VGVSLWIYDYRSSSDGGNRTQLYRDASHVLDYCNSGLIIMSQTTAIWASNITHYCNEHLKYHGLLQRTPQISGTTATDEWEADNSTAMQAPRNQSDCQTNMTEMGMSDRRLLLFDIIVHLSD